MTTAPPVMPKQMADAPAIFMGIFNKVLKDQEDSSVAQSTVKHL